jgi:hypothetical protein
LSLQAHKREGAKATIAIFFKNSLRLIIAIVFVRLI